MFVRIACGVLVFSKWHSPELMMTRHCRQAARFSHIPTVFVHPATGDMILRRLLISADDRAGE
jgi:hypothetical protein